MASVGTLANKPIAASPAAPLAAKVPHLVGDYPANRQHRDVDGANQLAQARQAEQRRALGLADRRIDRARHQIIDAAAGSRDRL